MPSAGSVRSRRSSDRTISVSSQGDIRGPATTYHNRSPHLSGQWFEGIIMEFGLLAHSFIKLDPDFKLKKR